MCAGHHHVRAHARSIAFTRPDNSAHPNPTALLSGHPNPRAPRSRNHPPPHHPQPGARTQELHNEKPSAMDDPTPDLTTPDCAERARTVWAMYRDLHGDQIPYLITDLLHLADVDEHPGGGIPRPAGWTRYPPTPPAPTPPKNPNSTERPTA